MIIGKDFVFDSAHKLLNHEHGEAWNRQMFGKCNDIHGHTYKLRVEIGGGVSTDDGMLMNFVDLMELVNAQIIDKVDHQFLNDVEIFGGCICTAENMVRAFWKILEPKVLELKCSLHSLTLWETPTSYARMAR